MNYGSLGKRLAAAIVDSIVVNLIGTILCIAFYDPIYMSVSIFVSAGYYILCEGGSWHATVGKRLFNLSVVDANGMGIDYSKAAIRYFGRILSGLFLGIGFLMALFSNEYQTLHDKLAGTYVIDGAFAPTPSAGPAPMPSPMPAPAPSSGRAVVGLAGEAAGMRFPITGNGLLMGRDPSVCQVVLNKSAGISRMHCLVSYNPSSGKFIITDRNSTYGTYTGSGVKITPERSIALNSGEKFYLGSPENLFELQ